MALVGFVQLLESSRRLTRGLPMAGRYFDAEQSATSREESKMGTSSVSLEARMLLSVFQKDGSDVFTRDDSEPPSKGKGAPLDERAA